MIKLYDNGVYLVNGTDIVEDNGEAAAALTAKCGQAPSKQEAAKGTMAYSILEAHNTSGNMEQLQIKFDKLTSHDITFVGIIQTARASGLEKFPIPYVLTNCHNSLCAVGGTINEDDHMFGLSCAKKYGEVIVAASSKDKNYSYIPDCSDLDIPEDTDYVYICENETIHGVTWNKLPNTKGHVLVSDQSSMFLSKPCNVSDYGMIYAGVQKNVGPAGMVVVIIREDLIREDIDPKMPVYMSYKTHADNGSMYNTPNCWAIYCCGKVFKYLKSIGGLEEMHKRNIAKAKVIYDFLDQSKMFKGTVEPEFRSLMNIPFVTGSAELDAEVVAATKAAGYDNLKGHKSVGGLRASVYNAMPIEGAEALVAFLKKFEAEHTN
mgnify:CR=1 FL=1